MSRLWGPLPSDFEVYTEVIYGGLVKPIIETLALVPEYVAAPVVNIILMGVTFSILWQGLELIRGAGGANPILDVIAKSLRPMLVLMFAATASAYNENVRIFLQHDLLSFFLDAFNDAIYHNGTPPGANVNLSFAANATDINLAIFNKVEDILNIQLGWLHRGFDVAKYWMFRVNAGLSPTVHFIVTAVGIPGGIAIGITYIVVFLASIAVMLQFIYLVVAWNFVLAFGPIFIALYAFPKTESYATHWLQSVLKYTFSIIVLLCLYSFVGNMATMQLAPMIDMWAHFPAEIPDLYLGALKVIAITIAGSFLVSKSEQLSQDLIGGGISGSGAFAASGIRAMTAAVKAGGGAMVKAGGIISRGGLPTPLADLARKRDAQGASPNPRSAVLNAQSRNSRVR